MAKDKDDKGKAGDKSKGKKLDVILEKLSRIEGSVRKLSKQQDGVGAEIISVLKASQSRTAKKEKNVTKPVPMRPVVVAKPTSSVSE